MTKLAMVFPGQGSQKIGMMNDFASVVRDTFNEASDYLGEDLWQLVSEGPDSELNKTVNTQPVMLAAGIAVWRLWLKRGGQSPKIVAGHSLGEYTALVASGVLRFADAIPLVRFRAAAMQAAVPIGTGAMAAILNLPANEIIAICNECSKNSNDIVEAVNFNEPNQTVIAGSKDAVEAAMEMCKQRGAKRALALPVSAPFHSSLMRPAAEALAEKLASLIFSSPQIPLVNNVDVRIEVEAKKIRAALIRQADHPVRWVETMSYLVNDSFTHVAECGPGKVLSGLVKRNCEQLTGLAFSDQAAIEAALAI